MKKSNFERMYIYYLKRMETRPDSHELTLRFPDFAFLYYPHVISTCNGEQS